MAFSINDLISHAKSHGNALHVAARHLADARDCLSHDGLCPAKVLGSDDGDKWQKQLAEAESRLVWSDPGCKSADLTRYASEAELPEGMVLKFDAVLTSKRKDRDGDILEPMGCKFSDNGLVLLWQHNQMTPIGRMIKSLGQDESKVSVQFGIADTALGRDAATLVKFGALSISHGFKAKAFEPLEFRMKDGVQVPKSWHIKEYETYEGSLVSIPANVDAGVFRVYEKSYASQLDGIRTAFGRDELETPVVKSWAKRFYEERPTQVAVPAETKAVDLQPTPVDSSDAEEFDVFKTVTDVLNEKAGAMFSAQNKKKIKGCCDSLRGVDKTLRSMMGESEGMDDGKDAAPPVIKNAPPEFEKGYGAMSENHLEGSFEWVQEKLHEGASKFLRSKDLIKGDSHYCHIACTFADRAIICCIKYSDGEREKKCYQAAWSLGDDGKPEWTGDAKEVEITPTVRDKWFADIEAKRDKGGDGDSNASDTLATAAPHILAKHLIEKAFACKEGRKAINQVRDGADLLDDIEAKQSMLDALGE